MATPSTPRLLVVDDEPGILALLERFAQKQGFEAAVRLGSAGALAYIRESRPDAVIVDLMMPGMGGLEVLRGIRALDPECQVILMTGSATVDSAIEAVKAGALDYITKPLDLDRLAGLLRTVREGINRRERLLEVEAKLADQFEFHGMIGRGPIAQELFDTIRRLAPHVRTAMVTGETGTGKELVARALHELGGRPDRRFVACNCSAIVEALFESELFGHTRGAFTGANEAKPGLFEVADGGTLFLDEIGELPLVMQAKLLRVVECGEVRRVGATEPRRVEVRVITATNRNLLEEVRVGRFRQDLYYRLNIVEILLPPLRERREDVPYLSASFVREFATRFGKAVSGMSAGAERLLLNAPWPGNIRELRNTLERACMLSEGRILSEREVLMALGGPAHPAAPLAAADVAQAALTAVPPPELHREQVEQALQRVGGNKSAAARMLGVSRRSLYRRLDVLRMH
jgi:two-component system response regulator HydG